MIRELSVHNLSLQEELDVFILENDRLKLQLEQKKTQLALVEEKKAETELKMKREFKFLLEHYLKAKERLQDSDSIPLSALASVKDVHVPEFQSHESSEDQMELESRLDCTT